MNIGNKLRGMRAEKGFSTAVMADKLGIADVTYRRFESGKSFPDIEMMDKMAKALEKNFVDLLPNECLIQNNNDQKGGISVTQNLGTINNLSEKLIETLEQRVLEKEDFNKELKSVIVDQKTKIESLEQLLTQKELQIKELKSINKNLKNKIELTTKG